MVVTRGLPRTTSLGRIRISRGSSTASASSRSTCPCPSRATTRTRSIGSTWLIIASRSTRAALGSKSVRKRPSDLSVQWFEDELGRDRDRRTQGAVDRAAVAVEAVNPLGSLTLRFGRLQLQSEVDPLDDENSFLLLEFARCLPDQPISRCRDLAHLQ